MVLVRDQTEQWNKIYGPEIESNTYKNSACDKGGISNHWDKIDFKINGAKITVQQLGKRYKQIYISPRTQK